MKTVFTSAISIFIFLGMPMAPLVAQPAPVKLAHGGSTTSNQYPSVMPYNNGDNVLAVWIEGDLINGVLVNKRLVYRIYADGTWGSKQTFLRTGSSEFPQLEIDSSGTIHMVWMEGYGTARDIAYATFKNGSWNHWEATKIPAYWVEISLNNRSVWPRIAVDSDDTVHVIWSHHFGEGDYATRNDVYHAYKTKSGTWSSPVNVSNTPNLYKTSYHADIAARNGHQYAVWQEYTGETAHYAAFSQRKTGGSWSAKTSLSGNDWPMVGGDWNNVAHALSNYGTQLRYERKTSGIWSDPIEVNSTPRSRQFVDIEVDDFNNVYAAFQQSSADPPWYSNTDQLAIRTCKSNGEWNPVVPLYNGEHICAPVVKADNNGGLHVICFDAYYGGGSIGSKWVEQGSIWYVKAQGVVSRRVKVLSPNGGEIWRIGQEQTLTWELTVPAGETPPDTVILEYSLDGGATWNMLYDALPNLGYATAEIPRDVVEPSTQCRFKITDPDSGVSDASDADFTLLPPYAETGGSFVSDGIWQDGATAGVEGWHVGDFTGDGKEDLLNILINYNKVFASDGTKFIKLGRWLKSVSGLYGWSPGDYNGDDRTDLLRFIPANEWGPDRAQAFLSTGESFVKDYVWTYTNPGSDGYTVGDYNGDGKDDILTYDPISMESRVCLSTGSEFLSPSVWFTGHNGMDGWYTGDFNGDDLTDLARVHSENGTVVLLSTGSSFALAGVWTTAVTNSIGWLVGDVDGDGDDDLARFIPGMSTADVFLAADGQFVYDGSWSDIDMADCDWRAGDFNGDDRDDLLNFDPDARVTRVYLSTAARVAASASGSARGFSHGDLNRGIDTRRPVLSAEAEADLLRPWLERMRNGEEGNYFFSIKREYEKRLGHKVRDVVIYRMLYRFLTPLEKRAEQPSAGPGAGDQPLP
jgi:hypothetical protein